MSGLTGKGTAYFPMSNKLTESRYVAMERYYAPAAAPSAGTTITETLDTDAPVVTTLGLACTTDTTVSTDQAERRPTSIR